MSLAQSQSILSSELPSAANLLSHLILRVRPLLTDLNMPSNQSDYNSVMTKCNEIKSNMIGFSGARVLYTAPDGTVIFDSGIKIFTDNTYDNYVKKSINENHNSRPAIMCAQLSLFGHGLGVEQKFSTSTKSNEIYAAIAFGSRFNNQGTMRISYKA
jgi:hypothetical protein